MSTKIHTICDALGNPTAFHLRHGQGRDLEGADNLLPGVVAEAFIADKAYVCWKRVLEPLAQKGIVAVIPPKSNIKQPWSYDVDLYRARHLIENFFARLKQYRGIATKYDKTAVAFPSVPSTLPQR